MRFLIDEDLPRTLGPALAADGHDVVDARDVGLRSKADADVFAYAQVDRRALLTMDLDFAAEADYPLGSHHGIVIARIPTDVRKPHLVEIMVRALASLSDEDIGGNVVVIEASQLRIRRARKPD